MTFPYHAWEWAGSLALVLLIGASVLMASLVEGARRRRAERARLRAMRRHWMGTGARSR